MPPGLAVLALLEELPRQLTDVRKYQRAGNLSDLKDIAHRVRGSAEYCGVPALGYAAKALEAAVSENDPDRIDVQVGRFQEEVERLLEQSGHSTG